jgi:catalase
MSEDKRKLLIENTVSDMKTVTDNIKYRHASHCYLADKDYGMRLALAMGLDIGKIEELSLMKEQDRLESTKEGTF